MAGQMAPGSGAHENTAQGNTAQGMTARLYPFYKVSWRVRIRNGLVLIKSERPPQLLKLSGEVVSSLQQLSMD